MIRDLPNAEAVQQHGEVDGPDASGAQSGQQRGSLSFPAEAPQDHLHTGYPAVPVAALANVGRLE